MGASEALQQIQDVIDIANSDEADRLTEEEALHAIWEITREWRG